MRILLASAAAAAVAFAATPAFAQYGGSPQEQVEDAPDNPDMSAPQDDEDAMTDPGDAAEAGAPAYADNDQDMDIDNDVDADLDMDAEDADGEIGPAGGEDYAYADLGPDDAMQAGPGDADEDVDAAEGPEEEGAPAEDGTDSWQGEDGRTYCRRSDGTTGLIVGGGAGALVGRGIDGGRHRGTGTIIGAIAGAAVGSAIEQSANRQSCR